MHGAPRRVLVRYRRSEQSHEPIAAVLVDGALEAVNFSANQLEAALDDAMDLLRIELLAECGEIRDVSEQDGHLPPLSFQRRARSHDLLGKIARYVRNKSVDPGTVGLARF